MWATHDLYGRAFTSALDKIVEEFGPMPSVAKDAESNASEKGGKDGTPSGKNQPRKRPNQSPASTTKRAKVSSTKIALISEVGVEGKLLETPLANIKNPGVNLHCKVGNKAYIFNTGTADCLIRAGTVLVGFGKGTFKHVQQEGQTDFNHDKDIPYILNGPEDEARDLNVQMLVWVGVRVNLSH